MTLVPCKIEEIKKRGSKSNLYKCIKEFYESDAECVRIENSEHKNAKVCRECFAISIKRHGFTQFVKAVQRGDEVYLVKRNLSKK